VAVGEHRHGRAGRLRSRTRRALLPLAAVAALGAVAGCGEDSSGGGTDASADTGRGARIGIMIKNTSLPFQGQSIAAFEEYGKKYGYDVAIRSGEGQLAQQVSVVQQYVAEKVDMILMNPSDPVGILPAIAQANAADIPVIIVNSEVASEAQTVCYVGVDDVVFGEKQGEAVVDAIGERGKVAVVLGAIGDPPEVNRLKGLERTLSRYPGIEIVAKQTGNWDAAASLNVAQDFLSRYGPGELDAIVMQSAFAQAAEYAHSHDRRDVKFILGDFPSSAKEGIEQGFVEATVNQDPYDQGVEAMRVAHEYLSGNERPCADGKRLLPLPIVTKANVDQYEPGWDG
jgi:ABC-type sugar transport system substrate-binding protein